VEVFAGEERRGEGGVNEPRRHRIHLVRGRLRARDRGRARAKARAMLKGRALNLP